MCIFAALAVAHWFKASKTLLGIETQLRAKYASLDSRFKASKTLLGIETGQLVIDIFDIH